MEQVRDADAHPHSLYCWHESKFKLREDEEEKELKQNYPLRTFIY